MRQSLRRHRGQEECGRLKGFEEWWPLAYGATTMTQGGGDFERPPTEEVDARRAYESASGALEAED